MIAENPSAADIGVGLANVLTAWKPLEKNCERLGGYNLLNEMH